MKNYRFVGESALILTTVIWGATFALIKAALSDISPMVFISIRFAAATVIIFPFVYPLLKHTPREAYISGLLLGFFYFLGFASQTAGLKYTSATKSGFITGSFILFIPILQYIIEKRKPGRGSIIGVLLVITGLVLLSSKGNTLLGIFTEIGGDFNLGDFLTLICAFSYAVYVVYLDIISKKYNYMPLVFMQVAVTAVGGILLMQFFSGTGIETPFINFSTAVIVALLYTSILSTVITTILQTKYQKVVSPTKAGIIFSFEPIFASLVAFFMLGEKISNFGLLGCVFIFSGLLATELIDKQETANEQ